jgi:hypothetical protein
MAQPDIITSNLGSIVSLQGNSPRGERWLAENVDFPDYAPGVVEHRYAYDIMVGAIAAGLVLQDADTGRIARITNDD